MNTFWIKLILMPLVIAGVTLAGRKWGNVIGGLLASLPWVAGPIILFIALEQGAPFAVEAISGVMIGIISWLGFCVVYVLAAQRYNALTSMLIGYVVYLIIGLILQYLTQYIDLNLWFIITLGMIFITLKNFPKVEEPSGLNKKKLKFEIPFRMLMITSFVLAITFFADKLGPTWSGILTPFPIMTAVLAVFTQYTESVYQVRQIFLGLLTGIFGFTTFLFSLAYLIPLMGIGSAFVRGIILDLLITIIIKKLFTKYNLAH